MPRAKLSSSHFYTVFDTGRCTDACRDWLMRWRGIVISCIIGPIKCGLRTRSRSRGKDANGWRQTCPDRPGQTRPPDPLLYQNGLYIRPKPVERVC